MRLLVNLILLASLPCQAFIPPAKFIVEKMVGKSGTGLYTVEQDVVFSGTNDTLTLREVWHIDGNSSMRLTVRPPKELQDQIKISYLYKDGLKHYQKDHNHYTSQIPPEFIEQFFYERNRDEMLLWLVQEGILLPPPPPTPTPRPQRVKRGQPPPPEEFVYKPEANVRLARHAGVVSYAFGMPGAPDGEPLPGFWIEQDLFLLRKFRLRSKAEVVADHYTSFPRGLWLPQQRIVRWNQKNVQVNLVRVMAMPPAARAQAFSLNGVESTGKVTGISDSEIASAVEEFYERFR